MTVRRPVPHVDPAAPHGSVTRGQLRLLDTRLMLWLERTLPYRMLWWRIVPRIMRLSRGRLARNLPLPTVLLETKDARNGRPHRRALFYFHDGGNVVVIATKAGLPCNPFWYQNALTDPDVRLDGEPFVAQPVGGQAELARLWTLADRYFPPFASMRSRAARLGRRMPLLQLRPS